MVLLIAFLANWWSQVWPNIIANLLASPAATWLILMYHRAWTKKREQELHEHLDTVHRRMDEVLHIHEDDWARKDAQDLGHSDTEVVRPRE